jgi:hypothetical protein
VGTHPTEPDPSSSVNIVEGYAICMGWWLTSPTLMGTLYKSSVYCAVKQEESTKINILKGIGGRWKTVCMKRQSSCNERYFPPQHCGWWQEGCHAKMKWSTWMKKRVAVIPFLETDWSSCWNSSLFKESQWNVRRYSSTSLTLALEMPIFYIGGKAARIISFAIVLENW